MARLHEKRLRNNMMTQEIVDLYKVAADAGYTPAKMRVADLTLEGTGVPQDVDAALAVFNDLAAAGLGAATSRLGKLKEFGGDRVPEFEQAVALYQKAVEQGYETAELYEAKLVAGQQVIAQDLQNAITTLKRFAENNDVKAAIELGRIYTKRGLKLSENWHLQAERWYRKAIELGSNDARHALARVLEDVAGRPTEESMKLIREAANSKHGRAMRDYGRRLFRGRYLDRDQTEGLAMILVSARMQTSGAMESAIEFMSSLEDNQVIAAAQVRSEQIWEDFFASESVDLEQPEEIEESDLDSLEGEH
jgi:TPR repeat protein